LDVAHRHELPELRVAGSQSGDVCAGPAAANREIYLYQGADRAQKLVSRAKKKGDLSLYTTMTPEDASPMIAAFEQSTVSR